MRAIKILQRSPSKPTLRERLVGMKAKAEGITPETNQGRRAMLAGSMAAALPLPALAASAPVASDGRADYLARLLNAYAEDRASKPIGSGGRIGSVEEEACRLVLWRCWDLCEEILALPTPRAFDGLALAALAATIELEVSLCGSEDRQMKAAVALTRAVLAITGTALPPGFAGFGDEPDSMARDAVLFRAQGSLPAWAIAEAEAEASDDA
ncbi:hypothetical protein FV226_26505 [Methylobacterium sp. WL12]|uniref:hypothetical protein n=1 Tax=Methylobacterium sp. WL12 TaxID=2603890 RepID=UPI0011C93FED|nr:hypothetical protein [Methylobacterium sp. WL12]TXM64445.1 hypothetical protein FV226_26505 [Methylobacterium sp. WL12]